MSDAQTNQTYHVKPEQSLLDRLVCPVTHGTLEYSEETGELISKQAGLAFPVKDGIPLMLPDEARKL